MMKTVIKIKKKKIHIKSLLVRFPDVQLLWCTNRCEMDNFLSIDFISNQYISLDLFEYEVSQVYALIIILNDVNNKVII